MFQVAMDWNPKQARLKEIIGIEDRFEETISLLFHMHSLLHTSDVYQAATPTYMDGIWEGMDGKAFRTVPTAKDATVAWDIWHITRIEDLTANLLIAKGAQVIDDGWSARLNTGVKDTGNAMTDEEILRLSKELSPDGLRQYRDAVGRRTREIIGRLRPGDTRRKVEAEQLSRILQQGGVTSHPDSIWLLDFWGRKTVGGLFLMPITRHQIVHLNDCVRLKEKCQKQCPLR